MRLTILGGHGTVPVAGGACSGYLLEHDGFRLWVDAGNGTLGKLQQHWPIDSVDAVWISHAHADHCADLFPFFFNSYVTDRVVPVYSPTGVSQRLAHLVGDDSAEAWRRLLDWRTIDPGDEGEIGPWKVRGFGAQHSVPNTVLRMESAGKVLTYTGDTGPHPDLDTAARDADLFLCEASWVDPSQVFKPIHLLASQAAEVAAKAAVDRLILTHVWSVNDPVRVRETASSAFDGPLDLAFELEHIEV
ncbi:MAG: MBL fold metallo-hydrolase [Actinomycetota bacterium]